jgi:hypothetical protein
MKLKKSLPLSRAQRKAARLHHKIAHERSQCDAIKREKHLRSLMGLPSRAFSDGTSIRDEP